MSNIGENFEIPEQVREVAKNSVESARKAFDDIIEATKKGVDEIDEKSNVAQSELVEANKKALAFTEESVGTAFDFAQKLARAKDVQEVMNLQKEYLENQIEFVGEKSREWENVVAKSFDATK